MSAVDRLKTCTCDQNFQQGIMNSTTYISYIPIINNENLLKANYHCPRKTSVAYEHLDGTNIDKSVDFQSSRNKTRMSHKCTGFLQFKSYSVFDKKKKKILAQSK